MVKCGACGKFISSSAADCARCEKCSVCFHKPCVSLPVTISVKSWMCPGCKIKIPREDNTTTPVKGILEAFSAPLCPPVHDVPDETTLNATEQVKLDLALELRSFRSEMCALRAEIQAWRVEIADLKSMLTSHDEKLSTMESRIPALEGRIDTPASGVGLLENAIAELKLQLNDKDQELFSNDIDLSGVPERSGENVMSIIQLMSVKLGVDYDERDVVRAGRVGSSRRNRVATDGGGTQTDRLEQRPRNITVRFARQITREQWLSAARVRRMITSVDVDVPGPPCRIYINERLTRTNQRIFYLARSAGRRFQWKYIWTKNGRIFARKIDGQPVAQIRTEDDIAKIFT